MATPNVSGEQSLKQSIRGNIAGGANTWWSNPDYATAVDAFDTNYGVRLYGLVVSGGQYTISGINGTATVTGTVTTTTTVSSVVGVLQSAAATGTTVYSPSKSSDFVTKNRVELFVTVATGTAPTLTAISGVTLTAITGALTVLSAAFPNYYGTPNANPTWVDDATVHAYPVNGVGAVVQDTTMVVQKQVRQIKTSFSETQVLDGYLAVYSGNLYQTQQKNTKNQQC